jgi:hypothetical protein
VHVKERRLTHGTFLRPVWCVPIAKILFLIFVVIFLVTLTFGLSRR